MAVDELAVKPAVVCVADHQLAGYRPGAHRYATRLASSSVSGVAWSRSSRSAISQPPRRLRPPRTVKGLIDPPRVDAFLLRAFVV